MRDEKRYGWQNPDMCLRCTIQVEDLTDVASFLMLFLWEVICGVLFSHIAAALATLLDSLLNKPFVPLVDFAGYHFVILPAIRGWDDECKCR